MEIRRFSWQGGIRVLLALIIGFSLILGASAPVKADGLNDQLTIGDSWKDGPSSDGKTVVWQEDNSLKAERLLDKKAFTVVSLPAPQTFKQFEVDGDYVIWEQYDNTCSSFCDGPVYGKNLATGQQFRVSPEYYGRNIAISGKWAVYVTQVPVPGTIAEGIRVRNLETMDDPTTLNVLYASTGNIAMDGNRLLWGQTLASYQTGIGKERWQLVTTTLDEGSPMILDQIDFNDYGTLNQDGWDLKGDLAVYSVNNQLRAVNLKTGEKRLITDPNQRPTQNPSTNGRYIFWEDPRNYKADSYQDYPQALQGYDFQTGAYLGNVVSAGNNTAPVVRGDALAWNSGTSTSRQIYSAWLTNLLPTARLPITASTGTADRTFFPQTGHTLGGSFRNFWTKNGGLSVFGFSQTEEFEELNRETGKVFTVQYFERQRYEYHPENKGTPYEVLLGRLGVDEAQRRGLLNTAPFKPVKNSGEANCTYFQATQHKACGSFIAYWQSHGLDLGQPGNAYAESLALFGLPISEPFTDSQTGVTVQYFERARMEYHPENKGTQFEILLGLLGNQELKNRGWTQ